jgi:putative transposase
MTGEAINEAGAAFKKALIEASLGAKLNHHLGYEPGADKPEGSTNHRNGGTAKTVITGDGRVRIETPRDRDGSFDPLLIPKHARRFTGFDDKIVALYARGLTVREIQGYLTETYATDVSPTFISAVTDGVLTEVTAWQSRPLAWHAARRHARDPGPVDQEHRRRQILDKSVQRPENPRRRRHPDRGHRRTERHARGSGRGVSRDHVADLRRSSAVTVSITPPGKIARPWPWRCV